MSRKIVLLQGGYSEEREISLKSSASIHEALNELGYDTTTLDPLDFPHYLSLGEKILTIHPDMVFLGLHGGDGEDGTIQAFLSLLKIPFTGSGMKSSALSMDKQYSFAVASSIGGKIPDYLVYDQKPLDYKYITNRIGFPLVVKPNSSGSSVGVSIVNDPADLDRALGEALQYSKRIIVQRFVPGSELTVSILGNRALPVVEIKVNDGWYDYQNKYTKGKTVYEVPAILTEQETEAIQRESLEIFETFDCRAYARIDFRYDGQDFYFLEVNTLPGMTSLSLTPMAAKEAGISFPLLIKQIIDLSV